MSITNIEKEFRETFKPTISKDKYEGSYMLNVPYEEVVHFFTHKLSSLLEEIEKEIKEKNCLKKNRKTDVSIGYYNGLDDCLSIINKYKK